MLNLAPWPHSSCSQKYKREGWIGEQSAVPGLSGTLIHTMTLRLAISKPLLSCCYGSSKVVRKGLVVTHWRTLSGWRRAVSDAERVVGYPTSFLGLSYLLSDEISNVMSHFRQLASGRHIHPLFRTLRWVIWLHIRVFSVFKKAVFRQLETFSLMGRKMSTYGD